MRSGRRGRAMAVTTLAAARWQRRRAVAVMGALAAVGVFLPAGALLLAGALLPAGCADPCCTTDSLPINLLPSSGGTTAGAGGGLTALARDPRDAAAPFHMAVDTGSSLTLFRRRPENNERAQLALRDFDILDGSSSGASGNPVVRGLFRGIEVLPFDLDPSATAPDAVLGGAFLQNFSVQVDFSAPSMTLWSRQGATNGFLGNAGFTVIEFNLLGGAELTARSRPDFFGLTGPVEAPATRVVFRGCGAPRAFDPDNETQVSNRCCKRGDEVTEATGADLALVLATGIGPLVLSRSAWNRVVAANARREGPALTEPTPGGPLSVPSLSAAITEVTWSTLPRLALVDQEADDATNPGACVELGRSRRLEWVERHRSLSACAQPCDTDPRDATQAQNAAAYVEIGGDIPVAVIEDGTPLLQGLRAEIRPEGPEIDGLIGAGVLAHTAVELDYKSQPARALFTCAPVASCAMSGAPDRSVCWTSPRCPRRTNATDQRSCFCQEQQSLPATCLDSECQ